MSTDKDKTPSVGPAFRVLVVDDSAGSRAQMRETLSSAGFVVVEANEGREALWRAQESHYDCILTDLHMPTMDGLMLTEELRKISGYQSTPILVVTSDCSRERISQARTVGATAWLLKPIQFGTLAVTVRRAILKTDEKEEKDEKERKAAGSASVE